MGIIGNRLVSDFSLELSIIALIVTLEARLEAGIRREAGRS
jgi:hypothetical protein